MVWSELLTKIYLSSTNMELYILQNRFQFVFTKYEHARVRFWLQGTEKVEIYICTEL